MHSRTKHGLIALLFLAPVALGWTGVNNSLSLQPQSRLWIEGTSSLRGFECQAGSFDARVAAASPGAVAAVLAGQKAVTTVEVRVPARQLDCANGTMNEHMLKSLKADEHPEISFRLSSYELSRVGDASRVKLNGTLNLGGTQKPISFEADAREAAGGALQVRGTHEIRMTEFGLKPPTLMMGTLKVNERVKVHFDLVLKA
jgi:hypothetical protein